MTNQMSQIMSRVRLVVFLEIWDWESHVEVPNIFNGHHLVKLLQGKYKGHMTCCISGRYGSGAMA